MPRETREAYPLQWPVGVKRNKVREESKFATSTFKAWEMLCAEVRRFGGDALVLSTNVPLIKDGSRIQTDREPVDPGVAIYFVRGGQQMVFASDKWDYLRDNILAIAKTIEALRGIERWGSSDLLERAVAGFAELPASTDIKRPWRRVFGFSDSLQPSSEKLQQEYKALARSFHPDSATGSHEQMAELNRAYEEAQLEVGS